MPGRSETKKDIRPFFYSGYHKLTNGLLLPPTLRSDMVGGRWVSELTMYNLQVLAGIQHPCPLYKLFLSTSNGRLAYIRKIGLADIRFLLTGQRTRL